MFRWKACDLLRTHRPGDRAWDGGPPPRPTMLRLLRSRGLCAGHRWLLYYELRDVATSSSGQAGAQPPRAGQLEGGDSQDLPPYSPRDSRALLRQCLDFEASTGLTNDAAGDTPFSDILTFMLHEMHARDPGHATPSRTAALSTLLRLARRYPGMDATARADALGAIRTHLARVEEAEGRGEVATGHAGGSTWGREWRGERAVWESQGQRWSPSQGGADVAEGVTEAMASVKLDSARVDSARVEKTPSPSPSQRARQPLPASRVSHPDPHAHAPAARTASPPSRVSALSQEAEEERLRLQAQRNAEFGQRARVVVYDLETTGVSTARARIVEVAARVVALGASSLRWEEVPGATFHSLVNPGEPIPADATSVHGITDADVRGAPSPRDALLRFWAFVEEHVPEGTDLVLAAHNARRYDNVVMAHEMRRHNVLLPPRFDRPSPTDPVRYDVLDTLHAFRVATPAIEAANGGRPLVRHSLKHLASYFHLPTAGAQSHRAGDDVAWLCGLALPHLLNDDRVRYRLSSDARVPIPTAAALLAHLVDRPQPKEELPGAVEAAEARGVEGESRRRVTVEESIWGRVEGGSAASGLWGRRAGQGAVGEREKETAREGSGHHPRDGSEEAKATVTTAAVSTTEAPGALAARGARLAMAEAEAGAGKGPWSEWGSEPDATRRYLEMDASEWVMGELGTAEVEGRVGRLSRWDDAPVGEVPTIDMGLAKTLSEAGVPRLRDLLWLLPKEHRFLCLTPRVGEPCLLFGSVTGHSVQAIHRGSALPLAAISTYVTVEVPGDMGRAKRATVKCLTMRTCPVHKGMFIARGVAKLFPEGALVSLEGKIDHPLPYRGSEISPFDKEMTVEIPHEFLLKEPAVKPLDRLDDLWEPWMERQTHGMEGRVLMPVYASKRDAAPGQVRHAVSTALDYAAARQGMTQEEHSAEDDLAFVPDPLPARVREAAGLPGLLEAWRGVHQPWDEGGVEAGLERLKLQEMFLTQVQLHLRRAWSLLQGRLHPKAKLVVPPHVLEAMDDAIACLPFQATNAQRRVISEVLLDMASPPGVPWMRRLVHGDVGSGKTAVAFVALLAVAASGHQAALMAPTEIVAEQHARHLSSLCDAIATRGSPRLRRLFPHGRPPLMLLTGATPASHRRAAESRLLAGDPIVVVGTHALANAAFTRLGLAVIDEQHKFGVEQRRALLRANHRGAAERAAVGANGEAVPAAITHDDDGGDSKEADSAEPFSTATAAASDGAVANPVDASPPIDPHELLMSATPIPRSLGQVLHGDMALSCVDELPPGRQPVRTRVVRVGPAAKGPAKGGRGRKGPGQPGRMARPVPVSATPSSDDLAEAVAGAADKEVRRAVEEGGRAFLVCTRVAGSAGDAPGRITAEGLFARLVGPGQPLGTHARVALVHGQMPGREKEAAIEAFRAGECNVLVASVVVDVGVDVPEATLMVIYNAEALGLAALHQLRGRVGRGGGEAACLLVTAAEGEEQARRLQAMEATNDGFLIAEADLESRGAGEVLGLQQSGVDADWRLARMPRDAGVLAGADEAARETVEGWLSPDSLHLDTRSAPAALLGQLREAVAAAMERDRQAQAEGGNG